MYSKLKFYNSLTVVMMPVNEKGESLPVFPERTEPGPLIPWSSQHPEDEAWASELAEKTEFGGVQFVQIGDQGRLRWDKDSVEAIVVDGQHRLASLIEYKENWKARKLSVNEKKMLIPVVFVLLDKSLGFDVEKKSGSIHSVSRELFTDLNKNARKVDRARELILDDLSIESRCVRELVTNQPTADSDTELPLGLVRWQEDVARFDQKWFLNSLVNLDALVRMILDIKTPKDPLEAKHVDHFVDSLSESLGRRDASGTSILEAEGQTLTSFVKQNFKDEDGAMERPFRHLPPEFLDAAVENFRVLHKPWLVRMLTEFRPYSQLLEAARQLGMVDGEFAKFQSQTKKHREIIKEQKLQNDPSWHSKAILEPTHQLEELKGRDPDSDWGFKVVFQKALVRIARRLAFDGADEKLGNLDDLLAFMNELHERGLFRVNAELPGLNYDLWTFIARNPMGGKIKVSAKTEARLEATLLLWYYGERMRTASDKSLTAAQVARALRSKKASSDWPGAAEASETLDSAFNVKPVYGDAADELSDDDKQKARRKRIVSVMRSGIGDPEGTVSTEDDVE